MSWKIELFVQQPAKLAERGCCADTAVWAENL